MKQSVQVLKSGSYPTSCGRTWSLLEGDLESLAHTSNKCIQQLNFSIPVLIIDNVVGLVESLSVEDGKLFALVDFYQSLKVDDFDFSPTIGFDGHSLQRIHCLNATRKIDNSVVEKTVNTSPIVASFA